MADWKYGHKGWMVAWTPAKGMDNMSRLVPATVMVGPWPIERGDPDWTKPFFGTDGCCWVAYRDLEPDERDHAFRGMLLNLLMDGIAPADIEREFAQVETWHTMGLPMPSGPASHATLKGKWNPYNE